MEILEGSGVNVGVNLGKSRGDGVHIANPFHRGGIDIFWNHNLLKLTMLYPGVHLVNINIVNTLKIIFDVQFGHAVMETIIIIYFKSSLMRVKLQVY